MENGFDPIGREELLEFLNNHGVNAQFINIDNVGFSRTIAFTVYGINYEIEWYCNESTLKIGNHPRSARIPFRYVYYDTTYPLVIDNKSIGFAYEKFKRESIFDREFRYEVFRIPIEIKQEQT